MNHVVVTLSPGGEEGLRAILAALGGDWHVEGAGEVWRGEQGGPVRRVVGIQPGGEGTWVVAWRAEADVPDGPAYATLFGASAAGTIGLAVGLKLGGGLGALILAPVLWGTALTFGRRAIQRGLPDTAPTEQALGEAVRAVIARFDADSSGS